MIAAQGLDILEIWRMLRSRPSAADDRKIEWPKPIPYRANVLDQLRQQETLGYEAHPTVPRTRVETPIDWATTPEGDVNCKNWLLRFQSLQFIDLYIFAYLETGDASYLKKPLEMLIDWCRHYVIEMKQSEFDWSDMAVGYRSLKLSFFLDASLKGHLGLDQDEAAILLAAARRHIEELTDPAKLAFYNHGLFQLHGLAVLSGICWALPEAKAATAFCEKEFDALVHGQFNEEGVHLEHSPGYHFWVSDHLRDMLDSGWLRSNYYDSVSERIEEVKHWLRRPDGRIVPVGDTMTEDVPFRSPNRPPKPDLVSPEDQAVGRWYPSGGYAVYRSAEGVPAGKACMLFVNGAFHSRTHKHLDHLTFEYFHLGRPFIVEAGKPKALTLDDRGYINSTRAHNAIEIDDIDYVTKRIGPYGSALKSFSQTADGASILAEVWHENIKVRHSRSFRVLPWQRVEIEDRLRATSARKFTHWLHFHPDIELARVSDRSFRLFTKDVVAEVTFEANAPFESNAFRGVVEPRRIGWVMNDDYELVPTWSIGFTAFAELVDFRTTIVFR